MGRDSLSKEELLESILIRREKGWPREDWDYTEWEEAMYEFSQEMKKRRLV